MFSPSSLYHTGQCEGILEFAPEKTASEHPTENSNAVRPPHSPLSAGGGVGGGGASGGAAKRRPRSRLAPGAAPP